MLNFNAFAQTKEFKKIKKVFNENVKKNEEIKNSRFVNANGNYFKVIINGDNYLKKMKIEISEKNESKNLIVRLDFKVLERMSLDVAKVILKDFVLAFAKERGSEHIFLEQSSIGQTVSFELFKMIKDYGFKEIKEFHHKMFSESAVTVYTRYVLNIKKDIHKEYKLFFDIQNKMLEMIKDKSNRSTILEKKNGQIELKDKKGEKFLAGMKKIGFSFNGETINNYIIFYKEDEDLKIIFKNEEEEININSLEEFVKIYEDFLEKLIVKTKIKEIVKPSKFIFSKKFAKFSKEEREKIYDQLLKTKSPLEIEEMCNVPFKMENSLKMDLNFAEKLYISTIEFEDTFVVIVREKNIVKEVYSYQKIEEYTDKIREILNKKNEEIIKQMTRKKA